MPVRTADIGISQDGAIEQYIPPRVVKIANANYNVAVDFGATPGSPLRTATISTLPTNQWLLVWVPATTGNATTYPVGAGTAPP